MLQGGVLQSGTLEQDKEGKAVCEIFSSPDMYIFHLKAMYVLGFVLWLKISLTL